MFVTGKLLQPCVIFVSRAESHPQ